MNHTHYQALTYSDLLDYQAVTEDSLLAHIDKVQEILEEAELCRQQTEALRKMRIKQVSTQESSHACLHAVMRPSARHHKSCQFHGTE